MSIPTDEAGRIPHETDPVDAVLTGGPLAGRVVHVTDPRQPFVAVDEDGGAQEYRPDGTAASAGGPTIDMPVLRHVGPAPTRSAGRHIRPGDDSPGPISNGVEPVRDR